MGWLFSIFGLAWIGFTTIYSGRKIAPCHTGGVLTISRSRQVQAVNLPLSLLCFFLGGGFREWGGGGKHRGGVIRDYYMQLLYSTVVAHINSDCKADPNPQTKVNRRPKTTPD